MKGINTVVQGTTSAVKKTGSLVQQTSGAVQKTVECEKPYEFTDGYLRSPGKESRDGRIGCFGDDWEEDVQCTSGGRPRIEEHYSREPPEKQSLAGQ